MVGTLTSFIARLRNSGSLSALIRSCLKMSETPSVARKRESNGGDNDANSVPKKLHLEADRIKRRKAAILLAYSGQSYLGMQRNPGMKTIEEDLLQALLKSGYITEQAFTTPQVIQFQRAARTDKGVSAVRQVVSGKFPEDVKIANVNEHLPEQIRILSFVRTTKGFNSKASCNARTYSYTLPTFAFTALREDVAEEYRISPECIDRVNSTLKLFEGTHNFHNFTSRKRPLDPSANRYIMRFECGQPFVHENVEFAVLEVKGQSFLLHQIRKMIGLTLAISRGHTTVDTIEKAWKHDRIDIPMAPGLGLMLDQVHYDHYNQKYGSDGIHDALDWTHLESEIIEFKTKHIIPTIVNTEIKEKSMLYWLSTLPFHSYDIREQNSTEKTAEQDDDDTCELDTENEKDISASVNGGLKP